MLFIDQKHLLFCPKKVADIIVGTLPQLIKSLSHLMCRGVEKKVGITERGMRGVEIELDRLKREGGIVRGEPPTS